MRLTEGTLAPVSCLKDDAVPCDRAGDCCTLPIWKGLAELVDKYFDSMTLKEVAENARQQMIQNQRSNEKKLIQYYPAGYKQAGLCHNKNTHKTACN